MRPSSDPQSTTDQIKQLIAELEVPFDPPVIEWRVTSTTKSGKLRGQRNALISIVFSVVALEAFLS